MGYRCFYCHVRHATVAGVRECAEKNEMFKLLKRHEETPAPVIDLDAYRRRREELRAEARTRQDTNLAGIERARQALRERNTSS